MPEGDAFSIVAVFVGLGVALYYTPAVWRRRAKLDKRIIDFWWISLAVGLGSFVMVDRIFLLIGEIGHIPNLAWLLGYLILVAGLYCVAAMASRTLQVEQHQIKTLARVSLLFIILLIVIFFFGGIAFSSPNTVRTTARSFGELVYMNTV